MRQFFSKFWNDDYVIRDDVIRYPDIPTDSSWPNEQSGITSFYELWDRKSRISLMRVPLSKTIELNQKWISLTRVLRTDGHRPSLCENRVRYFDFLVELHWHCLLYWSKILKIFKIYSLVHGTCNVFWFFQEVFRLKTNLWEKSHRISRE